MRSLFRALADAYHWTPDQIGRLTLPQVDLFLGEAPKRKRKISQAEYERWRAVKQGGQ